MASDAVTAITKDHRVMERLFDECKKNTEQRPALVAEVKARLTAHSRAEEERVYPAIVRQEPSEAEEVHHGVQEHREAEQLLAGVEAADPQSPEFERALEEFVAAVKHHVEEEETEILPALKGATEASRLEELGAAFEERRKEILKQFGIDADATKQELYERAKEAGIPGRSTMSKDELGRAVGGAADQR